MKIFRPLCATVLLACCLLARPAAAQEGAPAEEVNLDFFYNNLQDKGDWLQTEEYGYVFRPRIGAEKADWRPYTDGYWAHTDEGWLWNSYEDFGWATYHYGRWTRLNDYGWVWVPGYEWAPAWVAWRGTSPDGGDSSDAPPPPDAQNSAQVNYIGWAPLPPEAQFTETVGFNTAVDYQYNLTPEYYNFVPVSGFGNPYIAPLVLAPLAAYGFWSLTHPYTNIVYHNYGWGRGIYAGGPRWGYYNAYAARPIHQYNIQRNFNFNNGGVNNFRPGRPVNGVMPVFAPRVNQANRAAFKPAVVKANVPRGQVQKNFVSPGVNPQQVSQAKALTQTQAAKAGPAKLPNAQARAITPTMGAGVPGAGPKNQLSPQNAARVQANQAAKGLPATIPGGAGAPNAGKVGGLPAVQTPGQSKAEARAARQEQQRQQQVERKAKQEQQQTERRAKQEQQQTERKARQQQQRTERAANQGNAGGGQHKTRNANVGGGGQPKAHNNARVGGAPKQQKAPKPAAAPKVKAAPQKKKNN